MECPICFESIVKQHKFRCNHSVCKSCFRNMTKKGQTMVYEIVYDTTLIQYETNRIQCPLCREDEFNKTQMGYLNALNKCFPGYIK